MLKKCKVVMLPTNQEAPIGNHLNWTVNDSVLTTNHPSKLTIEDVCINHLYILSDEEQQVGDFGLLKEADRVSIRTPDCGKAYNFQKVIATTDNSLNLPQPSQAFINKYVDLYNKGQQIEEVNVEYEKKWGYFENWKPKISSDNTITIRKIKDSYTREEVERLFHLLDYDLQTKYNVDCPDSVIDHWLKENL